MWTRSSVRRLTVAGFAGMDHVLVAPRERSGGVVDDVLAGHGLVRRVTVQVATFLMVPYVLVGTRRIATVPARMAAHLARLHPLRLLTPPVAVPGFTMSQAWHEIHRHDPAHLWLRGRIAAAAALLGSVAGGARRRG